MLKVTDPQHEKNLNCQSHALSSGHTCDVYPLPSWNFYFFFYIVEIVTHRERSCGG